MEHRNVCGGTKIEKKKRGGKLKKIRSGRKQVAMKLPVTMD
jgi:hypothetical protein